MDFALKADLLSFQLAHFGDDTCPSIWFVDAQTALEYDPAAEFEKEEDDGLGWYKDGAKRTLTDAQIEMFRHSEWEMILREQRRKRKERDDEDEMEEGTTRGAKKRTWSFSSDASSLDDDLVGLSKATHFSPPLSRSPSPAPTPSHQFPAFDSTKRVKATMTAPSTKKSSRPKKKQRKEEIAYADRNKRKWEEHVVTVEPVRGTWMYESKTENRVRREMDDVKAESVEMDY